MYLANPNAGPYDGVPPVTTGTSNPPYSVFIEADAGSSVKAHYQSITCMPQYRGCSFEVRIILPISLLIIINNFFRNYGGRIINKTGRRLRRLDHQQAHSVNQPSGNPHSRRRVLGSSDNPPHKTLLNPSPPSVRSVETPTSHLPPVLVVLVHSAKPILLRRGLELGSSEEAHLGNSRSNSNPHKPARLARSDSLNNLNSSSSLREGCSAVVHLEIIRRRISLLVRSVCADSSYQCALPMMSVIGTTNTTSTTGTTGGFGAFGQPSNTATPGTGLFGQQQQQQQPQQQSAFGSFGTLILRSAE